MSYLEQIEKKKVPNHIAIIMDGNGRWAKLRNLDRSLGHKEGISSVRNVIEAASDLNISFLTLYTFSTENWNRPADEVSAIMALVIYAIAKETDDMIKNNVRIQVIGDMSRIPEDAKNALNTCIELTSHCSGLTVILALSYSSKWEITTAVKNIAQKVKNNQLTVCQIDEKVIHNNLATNKYPDPELLIRTGGEFRISNFLLWQIAYSELYFTDTLWPNFDKNEFYKALVEFQSRERRFGKISEQIEDSDN